MCRSAVEAGLTAALDLEPELRRDRDAAAERFERLADKLLVRVRPVHRGGIEERDAALDRGANQPDHLRPIRRRPVTEAHPHAAETDRRHLETALAELARVHSSSFAFVTADIA